MGCRVMADIGRPSSYKPEFARQAEMLCEFGATDKELADFFEVSTPTIWRWGADFPEFRSALKAGKAAADERVERSLYHKAIGYSFPSEKVFQFQGSIIRAPVVEHVPPDTTACIFWLKNRRQQQWRDVHKHEHGGVGDFDKYTDQQLREFVATGAAPAGAGQVSPAAPPGSNGTGKLPH